MACKPIDKKQLKIDMTAQLKHDNPHLTDAELSREVEIIYDRAIKKLNEPKSGFNEALTHKIYEGQKPPYIVPVNGLWDTVQGLTTYAIGAGIIKPIKYVADTIPFKDTADYLVVKPAKYIFNSDWAQDYHKKGMSNSEGIYHKTVENLKNRSTPSDFVKRVASYMQLTEGVDYKAMSDQLSKLGEAARERNEIDRTILNKALKSFRKVTKDYTTKQKKQLSSLFNFSHIHLVSDDSISTMSDIDSKIDSLTKELNSTIQNTKLLEYGIGKSTKELANFYHTRKLANLVDEGWSERDIYSTLRGKYLETYMTLVAYQQLKLGGKEQLATLNKFKSDGKESGIYTELKILSRSASMIGNEIDVDMRGKSMFKLDNKTGRRLHFKKNYKFETVMSKAELAKLDPKDNWKELRPYKLGQVGVYVKERASFGQESGIVSSTTVPDDGIHISHDTYLKYKFNLKDNNIEKRMYDKKPRYVLRLTQDMLDQLEIDDEVPSAMYRSFAHNVEISDSMSTIKHIINHQTRRAYRPSELAKIESDLKKGIRPMFLNFDFSADSLVDLKDYPLVKENYTSTAKRKDGTGTGITSTLELPRYATMVHKDIRDQMLGYSKDPIFKNRNRYLFKAEQLLRDAVTMFSVHVAIVNPIKIGMDIVSNASILAIHQVPLRSIKKYSTEAIKLHKEFSKLSQEKIILSITLRGLTEKDSAYKATKARYDRVVKKVNNHEFKAASDNGFLQSLSTQMLVGDSEAVEGLQSRVDELLSKVDNYPKFAKILQSISDTGPSIVDLLEYANSKVTGDGTISTELERISNKFRTFKDNKQHLAFVSEILAVPGQSELVRYGGAMVTMVDLIAKWTLYKHTMDESIGSSQSVKDREDKAIDVVQGSFIDYRAALPEEIDQLKDLGLFMFPHFTMRIQKAIWSMLYRRTLSTGVTYAGMNELTNVGNTHIINSNIWDKKLAHLDPDNPNILGPYTFYELMGLK